MQNIFLTILMASCIFLLFIGLIGDRNDLR